MTSGTGAVAGKVTVILLALPQPNPSGPATTPHLHPPTPMAAGALSASVTPTASSRTTRICTCRLRPAPPQTCSEWPQTWAGVSPGSLLSIRGGWVSYWLTLNFFPMYLHFEPFLNVTPTFRRWALPSQPRAMFVDLCSLGKGGVNGSIPEGIMGPQLSGG